MNLKQEAGKAKKVLGEFKTFAMKGNVLDMAVGVMIGGAFSKIVSSLVNDMFMPLIGLIVGGTDISGAFIALDFKPYDSIDAATSAGVATLNYGQFLQTVIDFLLMAVCIFLMLKLVKKISGSKRFRQTPEKKPRLCTYCRMEISGEATRCPHCTSMLDEAPLTGAKEAVS